MGRLLITDQDLCKDLVDLAMRAGRHFQSSQTNWVHYNPQLPFNSCHQCIPLYENSLFILALFRTRLLPNIQEGKSLLAQFLYFQSPSLHPDAGNFPIGIENYPEAVDYANGLKILAPFVHILSQFGTILGLELKTSLENSLVQLLKYYSQIDSKNLNYTLSTRLAAGFIAVGKLLKNHDWIEKGKNLWEMHLLNPPYPTSSKELAELIVSLQLIESHFESPLSNKLKDIVYETWHPSTAAYVGPILKERQEGFEPQINLYDLILGYAQGCLSPRAKHLSVVHLQAALVFPPPLFEPKTHPLSIVQGIHENRRWVSLQKENLAVSILEGEVIEGSTEKFCVPLRLLWTDPTSQQAKTHSLIAMGRTGTHVHYLIKDHVIELFFTLSEDISPEDREKLQEIHVYLDASPEVSVRINDTRSTTFELGCQIEISTSGKPIASVDFEKIEGEGDFMGHLVLGNRPSQQLNSKTEMHAYDWHAFIRSLRRSPKCQIKMTVTLQ